MKLKYLPAFLDNKESYDDTFITPEISGTREANHKIREIGQLRRAKMHISCLIDDLDIQHALTPTLRELLEASLTLRTTSTKILAAYLKRSPATIRTEFLKILSILGERGKHLSV